MAGVKIKIELEDKASGAAKGVADSTEKAADAIGRLRDASGRFVPAGKQAGDAAEKMAQATGKAGDAFGRFLPRSHQATEAVSQGVSVTQRASAAWGRFAQSVRDSMAAKIAFGNVIAMGIAKLAQLGAAAIQAGVQLAKAFIVATAKAVQFGESIQFSLTRFLGGSDNASRALKDLMSMSNTMGVSFEESAKVFQDLISAGFTEAASKELVAFKADVTAFQGGSEAAAQKVTLAFDQIQKAMAMGRMDAQGFNSIVANLPVDKASIMAKLSKKMGVSFAEAMDTDITTLPVDKLIESLREAANEAFDISKSGDLAVMKQQETVSGMIQAIQARFGNLVSMIGMKLVPLLKGRLGPLFERIGEWFTGGAAEAWAERVAERLNVVVAAASGVMNMLAAVSKGYASMTNEAGKADAAQGPLDRIMSTLAKLGDNRAFLLMAEFFGKTLPFIIESAMGPLLMIVDSVLRVKDAFEQLWEMDASVIADAFGAMFDVVLAKVKGFISSITGAGTEVGAALVSGLVSGILGGIGAAVGAVGSLVHSVISTARSALQIKSPSKIFESIGEMTGAGMEGGIEASRGGVASSMAGMVDTGKVGQGGGGGGGGMQTRVSAPITVQAAADPEATAAAIKRVLKAELAGAFEEIAIEVGVVPA